MEGKGEGGGGVYMPCETLFISLYSEVFFVQMVMM